MIVLTCIMRLYRTCSIYGEITWTSHEVWSNAIYLPSSFLQTVTSTQFNVVNHPFRSVFRRKNNQISPNFVSFCLSLLLFWCCYDFTGYIIAFPITDKLLACCIFMLLVGHRYTYLLAGAESLFLSVFKQFLSLYRVGAYIELIPISVVSYHILFRKCRLTKKIVTETVHSTC